MPAFEQRGKIHHCNESRGHALVALSRPVGASASLLPNCKPWGAVLFLPGQPARLPVLRRRWPLSGPLQARPLRRLRRQKALEPRVPVRRRSRTTAGWQQVRLLRECCRMNTTTRGFLETEARPRPFRRQIKECQYRQIADPYLNPWVAPSSGRSAGTLELRLIFLTSFRPGAGVKAPFFPGKREG